MKPEVSETIVACATGAHNNTLRFPEIVERLAKAGVTQYHADFLRDEITYYGAGGESLVLALHLPSGPLAAEFDAAAVAAAVQASQREGIHYEEFLRRAVRAGCCGYIVYIKGQRVIYLGGKGDMHIEYFPGSKVRPASPST